MKKRGGLSKKMKLRRPETKRMTRIKEVKPVLITDDDEERSLQQMHIISHRWQTDLAFFNQELVFFRKLIDKYFMWLIDERNIDYTRKLASDLFKFEKRWFTISQKLSSHIRRVANVVENPFSHDVQQCKDEHAQLEALFTVFTQDFRRIKTEVFNISENVINSEKAKRLLNGI